MQDTDELMSEPEKMQPEETVVDESSILQLELDAANEEISSLKENQKASEEKLADAERRHLYLQAEFQTYRRRREDESVSLMKYINGEFAKTLLPAIDNLERAMQAADISSNFDSLKNGGHARN